MILFIQAFSGSSFGFMFGCILDNEIAALVINQFVIIVFNFGAGLFTSLGPGANWFVKMLGYISPFRYACEKMMRILLAGLPYVDQECDFF